MADPFLSAGGAIMIISSGITVCNGLFEYYASWKGFNDDIERIHEYREGLTNVLRALQTVLRMKDFARKQDA
jgi:hypothetical protein